MVTVKNPPRSGACGSCEVVWIYGFGVLTTILTIYRFGLRGNYGLCGTKKHGFRTKKHGKARKMRQKTDAFAFGSTMPQVRILSLRPNLTHSNVRNSKRTVNGLVRFFLCRGTARERSARAAAVTPRCPAAFAHVVFRKSYSRPYSFTSRRRLSARRFQVMRSTRPSGGRRLTAWKAFTASSVVSPKTPSSGRREASRP